MAAAWKLFGAALLTGRRTSGTSMWMLQELVAASIHQSSNCKLTSPEYLR